MYLKMSNTSGKYFIVDANKIDEFCIADFNCYTGIIKFKVQGYNKSSVYNTSFVSMEIPKHLLDFTSSDIYEFASMILVYKLNEMDTNIFAGISIEKEIMDALNSESFINMMIKHSKIKKEA